MTSPAQESSVVSAMEDFFASGVVTTRVAVALDEAEASYVATATTDDAAAHGNVALFRSYAATIDALLEEFRATPAGSAFATADVVAACHAELARCCGGPSPWTWVGYVQAALAYSDFCVLVEDMGDLHAFECGGDGEGEEEEAGEKDAEKSGGADEGHSVSAAAVGAEKA